MSCISYALEMVKDGTKLPAEVRRITRTPRWDGSSVKRQRSSCIMELRRQVARSSSILQVSFNERAQAWKLEVERQYRAQTDAGTLWPRPLNEPRTNMSSGVPAAAEALEAIWKAIELKRVKHQTIDEDVEASRVIPIVPETESRQRGFNADLDAAEYISLPRDSEISESSSGKNRLHQVCKSA